MGARRHISSGTPWEEIAGYARAVRVGNVVYVSGTTASDERGQLVSADDPGAQALYILQKIEQALRAAGASPADVARTRIYITDYAYWEPVARAHGRFFAAVRPANTLVVVRALVPEGALVEIEAEAVIA